MVISWSERMHAAYICRDPNQTNKQRQTTTNYCLQGLTLFSSSRGEVGVILSALVAD